MKNVFRIAVIGTTGCAESHHRALSRLESMGRCRVVATCDLQSTLHHPQDYLSSGLKIYSDYCAMLDAHGSELDYVVIPTPIHLHAEMYREVLRRGLACYLEKPPTLDFRIFDDMLQLEQAARVSTCVGFSHLFRAEYLDLKSRIVGGDFGRLRNVHFLGLWQRTLAYYRRNNWAGKLLWGNQLLLDSCLGNGMAHYSHLALFWSGLSDSWAWAEPSRVRAEMYRINPIEVPEIIFLEAQTDTDVTIRVVASTASPVSQTREILQCDDARLTISYDQPSRITIDWKNGKQEEISLSPRDAYFENHLAYMNFLAGKAERPLTRLPDCRGLVHLNALAYLSSGEITPLDPEQTGAFLRHGVQGLCFNDVAERAEQFFRDGHMPDLGRSQPSSPVQPRQLPEVFALVHRLQEQSAWMSHDRVEEPVAC